MNCREYSTGKWAVDMRFVVFGEDCREAVSRLMEFLRKPSDVVEAYGPIAKPEAIK